jgi:hypothetical protein
MKSAKEKRVTMIGMFDPPAGDPSSEATSK